MVEIFKALSDETRLRILSLVWTGELCVCEIEKCLNLTQSNASRHLTVLKNTGILSSAKHAQWAYYKVDEHFHKEHKDLYNYLDNMFKTHVNYLADQEHLWKCKNEDLCN